jgi:hypothetical protein
VGLRKNELGVVEDRSLINAGGCISTQGSPLKHSFYCTKAIKLELKKHCRPNYTDSAVSPFYIRRQIKKDYVVKVAAINTRLEQKDVFPLIYIINLFMLH